MLAALACLAPASSRAGSDFAVVKAGEALHETPADRTGVDPTDFIIRFEVTNEYKNLTNSGHRNVTTLRGDYVVDKKMILRLDVPFGYADIPRQGESFGLGDMRLRVGGLLFRTSLAAAGLGCDLFFDTATARVLGSGKYVAGPIAVISFYPTTWLRIYPNLKYRRSFAGDSTRSEINYFQSDIPFAFSLPQRWWIEPEPRVRVDFADDERATLLFEVEVGKLITKHVALWIRPKFFVAGKRTYDYVIETGFRYLFD